MSSQSTAAATPIKVLVVDDEPAMVALLQEWLKEVECEVYTALNAADGLNLFSEHFPTLTITDLRMPGIDGFELIKRLRHMSDAYIMAFTGLGSEEDLVRGLELGADEYLMKPLSRLKFLERVQSILRGAIEPEDPSPDYSDAWLTIN